MEKILQIREMPLRIPVKTSFGLNEEMKIVSKEHSIGVVDPIHEPMLKLSISIRMATQRLII